jgi:galactonate dehydratase
MSPDPVARIGISVAEVTPKTRWIFVEIETASGVRGTGEATLGDREDAVIAAVARFTPGILALQDAAPDESLRGDLSHLSDAAAFSALDQALWDIAAQRRGVALAVALAVAPAVAPAVASSGASGGAQRTRVPLYANVNRRTLDRSPAGFAASALDAIAAGHDSIKIAPFDEATPDARARAALKEAVEPGLARIAAVRAAIGARRRLMVDCHWRLDERAAEHVIRAAAELGVHWVECPLPETPEHIAALSRLRHVANGLGVFLAGCEQGIGIAGFAPFIDAGVYDVMMPDAKYVGGLAEMMRLAARMHRAGIAFSPHNPSGSVCHAVSLHVSAAVEDLHSLETQFDETALFDALAGAPFRAVQAGSTALPAGSGIGMHLQAAPLANCRTAHWVATQESRRLAPIPIA